MTQGSRCATWAGHDPADVDGLRDVERWREEKKFGAWALPRACLAVPPSAVSRRLARPFIRPTGDLLWASWDSARDHLAGPSFSFPSWPYELLWHEPSRYVITGDTSVGKTRAIVEWLTLTRFLARGVPRRDDAPDPLTEWARCAYSEARSARDAALRGDHEAVDSFSRLWLGVRDAKSWRDGVIDALLHGEWDSGPLTADHTFTEALKLIARRWVARWKPLWERMQNRQYVELLSRPLVPGRTDLGTLADTLTVPSTEDLVLGREIEDPRLRWILRQLAADSARDHAVARVFAENPRLNWKDAASAAGLPEAYGERVRRKLKRLARRYAGLCEASAATAGAAA
ncbi:hypothetical protein [Streptomyces sp. NPDC052114]|uniref:hypothetical protein n=1 Tax=unclassified Streptomyces TaxID=2593676 RepID=UPI0034439AF8